MDAGTGNQEPDALASPDGPEACEVLPAGREGVVAARFAIGGDVVADAHPAALTDGDGGLPRFGLPLPIEQGGTRGGTGTRGEGGEGGHGGWHRGWPEYGPLYGIKSIRGP